PQPKRERRRSAMPAISLGLVSQVMTIALVEAHKQIVITCDTYPKEIAGMEERLISRFGWGLTVAIEPPELEMRVAIVLKKAEADAVQVSEEIAFFIAKHIRSNVRELEGALKKVLAFARFTGREL